MFRKRRGRNAPGVSQDPEEVYADQFAAALLMPDKVVRKLWKKHKGGAGVVVMAYKFGVPADVMAWRLRDLGLLRVGKR